MIFPYDFTNNNEVVFIPQDEFSKRYPFCFEYLKDNEYLLRNREKGKMNHNNWYAYVYPKTISS